MIETMYNWIRFLVLHALMQTIDDPGLSEARRNVIREKYRIARERAAWLNI